jgi:hypothetical protein
MSPMFSFTQLAFRYAELPPGEWVLSRGLDAGRQKQHICRRAEHQSIDCDFGSPMS